MSNADRGVVDAAFDNPAAASRPDAHQAGIQAFDRDDIDLADHTSGERTDYMGAADPEGRDNMSQRDIRKLEYRGHKHAARAIWHFFRDLFLLLLVVFLGLPVTDGCPSHIQGEWPSEHWVFYLSAVPSVLLMFVTTPMFGFVLMDVWFARDPATGWQHRDKAHTAKLMKISALVTCPIAMGTVGWAIIMAKNTGFPVAFTHLICGMPGFGLVFVATVIMMRVMEVPGSPTGQVPKTYVIHLGTVTGLIMWSSVAFPFLGALLKVYPHFTVIIVLLFPVTRKLNELVLRTVFRNDFDVIVPFELVIAVNNAVFPASILPSAIGFWTYLGTHTHTHTHPQTSRREAEGERMAGAITNWSVPLQVSWSSISSTLRGRYELCGFPYCGLLGASIRWRRKLRT